jgi:putative endonuclease
MSHFVYILYSPSHDRFYIGETSDVQIRLSFHNQLNQGGYTSKFRPWDLMLQMEVPNYSTARRIERYIKRQKNRRCIRALIDDPVYREKMIVKFSVD